MVSLRCGAAVVWQRRRIAQRSDRVNPQQYGRVCCLGVVEGGAALSVVVV